MFYDEPRGWDGDMCQYEGLDVSAFQPPTDKEYRDAYAAYLKEEADKQPEEEQP